MRSGWNVFYGFRNRNREREYGFRNVILRIIQDKQSLEREREKQGQVMEREN